MFTIFHSNRTKPGVVSFRRERYRSRCDYFQIKLGGIWTYPAPAIWTCDDGRRICRCASCTCDSPCNHRGLLWLYGAPGGTVLVDDAIRAAEKAAR